ncbi:helix-turn-helix transcriptional regulator [Mucilaginibacter ginsenosidivorax]|uniref:Helix-turn-helix transcriptional regulator n=2 Tax=Mucilaginibacter ginsenosidivorax TaxID=862126 RepID=A0A5B8W140_9SPHI|nr:helix-turn-helix transcriptional regulator [Mucilaginibacter ginsenosidivorax]
MNASDRSSIAPSRAWLIPRAVRRRLISPITYRSISLLGCPRMGASKRSGATISPRNTWYFHFGSVPWLESLAPRNHEEKPYPQAGPRPRGAPVPVVTVLPKEVLLEVRGLPVPWLHPERPLRPVPQAHGAVGHDEVRGVRQDGRRDQGRDEPVGEHEQAGRAVLRALHAEKGVREVARGPQTTPANPYIRTMSGTSKETKDRTKRLLSARLKALRAERNMTQAALSASSGVSVGQIRKMEAGSSDSTMRTVERLSEALGILPNEFLSGFGAPADEAQ